MKDLAPNIRYLNRHWVDCFVTLPMMSQLGHLRLLEAESIHIIREVAAEFQRPVMLYSIGKDSSVMVRLAQKAFHPAPIPFPLLHIDTTYKFREMIEFRDRYTAEIGAKLIVHTNREAIDDGANPFRLGTQRCCGLLKTKALLDGLRAGRIRRGFRRRAARRGEIPRQGAHLFVSRRQRANGTPRTSGRNCGTCSTAAWIRAKASACFRFPTGPNWMSGNTSTSKIFPSFRCISPRSARCWCAATR